MHLPLLLLDSLHSHTFLRGKICYLAHVCLSILNAACMHIKVNQTKTWRIQEENLTNEIKFERLHNQLAWKRKKEINLLRVLEKNICEMLYEYSNFHVINCIIYKKRTIFSKI